VEQSNYISQFLKTIFLKIIFKSLLINHLILVKATWRNIMAFINEYISEEDIIKYEVKEAWEKISPGSTGPDSFLSKYTWTIDKDRDVYFIPMASGKEEFSNQSISALWWKGTLLSVSLASMGGYLDYPNGKGERTWALIKILKPKEFHVPDVEIIPILKDALITFGYDGIILPIKDYKVTFTF
jgi:hypothetical protein